MMGLESSYRPPPSNDQYPTQYSHDDQDSHVYESPPSSYHPPHSYSQHPIEAGGRRRSRASSQAPSDASQPQPISNAANAVNAALSQSDAAAQVDPALIAQITEQVRKQVIESLEKSGIAGVGTQKQQQPQQPQQPPQSPNASQPLPNGGVFLQRNVYTPPSPNRHEFPSRDSNSPELFAQEKEPQDMDNDAPTRKYGERIKVQRTMSMSSAGAPTSPTRQRPGPLPREPTDNEATTLEKIWQPLFNPEGHPTARLGQFLRGLANHIIDDYEPKRSIVITPAKMLRFYDEVKIADEVFPWHTVFGKLPNATICKMFRDLRCEHYLVQDQQYFDKVPHIPALTPAGFQTWMTVMITAYPDLEFQRLAKALLHMPISNADDAKERFPKELSRRLFPKDGNIQTQQRAASALSCDGRIPIHKSATFPPPPPTQPPGSVDRERSPYNSTFSDTSASFDGPIDEEPAVIIERERKPYTAREGTGKVYDDDTPNGGSSGSRTDTDAPRHHRTQSVTSQSGWAIPGATRSNTHDYPTHRASMVEYPPPPPPMSRHNRTNSNAGGRRPRSPSFSTSVPNSGSGYGTRSESNITDIPAGYYTSNINIYDQEDDSAARKRDYARRSVEEDSGRMGYGSGTAPRTVFDDDYYRGRTSSNGYAAGYGGYGQPPPPRY